MTLIDPATDGTGLAEVTVALAPLDYGTIEVAPVSPADPASRLDLWSGTGLSALIHGGNAVMFVLTAAVMLASRTFEFDDEVRLAVAAVGTPVLLAGFPSMTLLFFVHCVAPVQRDHVRHRLTRMPTDAPPQRWYQRLPWWC